MKDGNFLINSRITDPISGGLPVTLRPDRVKVNIGKGVDNLLYRLEL